MTSVGVNEYSFPWWQETQRIWNNVIAHAHKFGFSVRCYVCAEEVLSFVWIVECRSCPWVHDNSWETFFICELWEEVVSLASYRRAVAVSPKETYYVDK